MMEIGNLKATRISRVVLTLEMLLCFLIPTQALLAAFVAIALPPFTPFWSTPLSALLLTTSLIGPVGLFLAFKSIVLEQRQMSKGLAVGFCGLAGWTFVGNAFFVLSIASPGYELRGVFLMALLPLVGAVHLVYLANTEKGELAHA